MPKYFLIFFILSYTSLFAKPQTLLECLGKEEQDIHKSKLSKQASDFNRNLISDMLDLASVEVKSQFIGQICDSNRRLDSFRFLEVFLINKGKIFKFVDKTLIERSSQQAVIGAFYNKVLDRLSQYISLTQIGSPTPYCLFGNEPNVSKFLFRVMHLRAELSAKRLLHEDNLGSKVIKELRGFPEKAKNCPPEEKK